MNPPVNLMDPAVYGGGIPIETHALWRQQLIHMDPPRHTHFRRVLGQGSPATT